MDLGSSSAPPSAACSLDMDIRRRCFLERGLPSSILFSLFSSSRSRLSAPRSAQLIGRRDSISKASPWFSASRTRLAIGLFFLVTFAVTQMEVIFAIYLNSLFGRNAQQAGELLAVMGVIMVGIQGGAIGKLAKRFGEPHLIVFGCGVCSLALFGFGSFNALAWIVVALCFLALGHGVLHPSLSSLASKGAGADRRGATMGVFQSAGSLARVVGPPCAGFLYDQISRPAPFFAGSLVLGLAFVLTLIRMPKLEIAS